MFSIVIPTFDRLENLKLCLAALETQRDAPKFEVIIADDGSTDGTREWVHKNYIKDKANFELVYQWIGPNLGFRAGRARNIGIAQARYKHVIMIDSDILLNPEALYWHRQVRQAHPNIVVVGLYHWAAAAPITPGEIRESWEPVMKLVPKITTISPPQPGWDVRKGSFHETFEDDKIITQYDGLGFFSGNLSYPVKVFWEVGGFDEQVSQGEDAELSQKIRLKEHPVLQYEPIYGVHLHHKRDAATAHKELQESIAYIDRKYGIGTYAEAADIDARDMRLSIWYTRKMKAMLVKHAFDNTVYAVDGTKKHYVGLPEPFWVDLLDFEASDIQEVEKSFLDDMNPEGKIKK